MCFIGAGTLSKMSRGYYVVEFLPDDLPTVPISIRKPTKPIFIEDVPLIEKTSSSHPGASEDVLPSMETSTRPPLNKKATSIPPERTSSLRLSVSEDVSRPARTSSLRLSVSEDDSGQEEYTLFGKYNDGKVKKCATIQISCDATVNELRNAFSDTIGKKVTKLSAGGDIVGLHTPISAWPEIADGCVLDIYF
jgi:hypothetical protein